MVVGPEKKNYICVGSGHKKYPNGNLFWKRPLLVAHSFPKITFEAQPHLY